MSKEPTSAEIYSVGPMSPDLVLEAVRRNIPDLQSVVVSVVWKHEGKERQATYHSEQPHSDLAYHAIAVDDYIKGIINGRAPGEQ